jgi:hypothetical protein
MGEVCVTHGDELKTLIGKLQWNRQLGDTAVKYMQE